MENNIDIFNKKKKKKHKKKLSCSVNFYKEEPSKLEIVEVIFLSIVISVVGILVGYLLGIKSNSKQKVSISDSKSLTKFIETYQYIIDNYYGDEELSEDKLLESALDGLLSSIGDNNTTYLDENTSSNFNITLEGSYQGLGVEIANEVDTGNIIIISIFKDSPADKAGLKPGDRLLKIDGEDITEQTSAYFANYIKTTDKTNFELLISRDGEEQTIEVTREKVIIKSVLSKLFEKNGKKIGYLYLSIFANNTYEQLKTELEELESKNIDSLIIDLRDNTGGHMSSAKDILSLFLDSSKVVFQTQDKKGIVKTYSKGKQTKKYPIVLIANGNSASSSEILIAGLKDNLNAKLVGETTYGKGTVQELQTLPSGAQYKFTIKKWLTPNGICIDKEGIKPDYEIKLSEEYLKNPSDETDNQLQKALEILQ